MLQARTSERLVLGNDLVWKILEVVFIGLTAGCAVAVFFRSKSAGMHSRMDKQDDKIQELSIACLRREEFHNVIETLRGDNADIRRRVDDIHMLITNLVKKMH